MLFADIALAARIERAECRMLTDGAEAIARRHADAAGFVTPLAGGVAVYTVPGAPLNKVAGLGFAGPLDAGQLDAVERAYAERGTAVQVELANLAEPACGALLTRRGYTLQGFENVLARPLLPPPASEPGAAPSESIAITAAGVADLPDWLDTVITGFATPDTQGVPLHESFPRATVEQIVGALAGGGVIACYLAHRDGVAAGGASLRLWEGVAQLCGAATLPEHRRRGVQAALLRARLHAASRAGCDVAVITTSPGSKSQENAQRQGFALLYTRAILVRGGG